jgi:hypothetical protein
LASTLALDNNFDLQLDPAWDQFVASPNEERTPLEIKGVIGAQSAFNTN